MWDPPAKLAGQRITAGRSLLLTLSHCSSDTLSVRYRLHGKPWTQLVPRRAPEAALQLADLLRLLEPEPLVCLGGNRVERLVDRPRALLRVRPSRLVGVERGVDNAEGMAPVLRGPVLEREAAVGAV